MTAVVVLENAEITDVVRIPSSAVGIEGTSMYLKEGEILTVSDLLHGMLLQSGNDAAGALAHYVGGGDVSRFVEMMNECAAKLGMEDTHFENPSGLPAKEHYSSALDMAKLAKYALSVDGLSDIVATRNKTVGKRTLVNHNKLLRIYDGANGFKTGYTKAAGRCLVSGAARNGMQLIAVTLSAPDDWNDHTRLLDFGFENFYVYKEDTKTLGLPPLQVVGGEKGSVSVSAAGEIALISSRDDRIEKIVYLPGFVYAPICRGDAVGRVEYYKNGEHIETVTLVSTDTVDEYRKPSLLKRILNYFIKR